MLLDSEDPSERQSVPTIERLSLSHWWQKERKFFSKSLSRIFNRNIFEIFNKYWLYYINVHLVLDNFVENITPFVVC